jgi:anti-sigma regulatory factor (Ser/Thr protein kinase)
MPSPEGGDGAQTPTAGVAVDMLVAAVPDAGVAARAAVVTALTDRVAERVLADALLLVSELVSNSVRHAGLSADQSVRVVAGIINGVLRLEVEDPGTTGTVAARVPDLQRGGGFGLRLVEALADSWGTSREGHTRVWAELACWPPAG